MVWPNDIPVSNFKGRPRQVAGGAAFRGVTFDGAFVAKSASGKTTIFRRKGAARYPLREQGMPVKDRIDVYVQDEIFDQAIGIFMRYFRQDLRARAVLGVGR